MPIRVLIVVAIAQIVGWGSVSLTSIVGTRIAADLGVDIAAVFAGNSVHYGVMGLCAPFLARAFERYGARRVMIAGSLVACPGFALLAVAQGYGAYLVGWVILGAAGSATLTTAPYILLTEIVGRSAGRAIGAMMLMTGLSSSVFWPTTAFLSDFFGWRGTCGVYAVAMWLVCVPLYLYGVPRRATAPPARPSQDAIPAEPPPRTGPLALIAAGTALIAFVGFGLSAVLVELLIVEGLSRSEAIGYGSALGVIQIGARAMDFLGGGRWDGLTTGLFAALAVLAALLLLAVGDGGPVAAGAFILLYGLGSGAMAVARATIPLVFFDRATYARAASRIALPLNLASALSPPALAAVLTRFGGDAVLVLAAGFMVAATVALLVLARRRPRAQLTVRA
ncbi:MFS transporter [Methylobacterium sp. J-072]|uniref:MFS transporter n=1 Tax=Methylobacterium sp. J-072 TaxID=2836651 RepID=UPI001FBB28AA|nr:MFS transporter [Methylobacterium sp. J-072]MCJ2097087.1 MFS transporter [Methylobacterium sp. J-072]